MKHIRLKCAHCGQPKFIGDSYYAHGTYYVDVTCVACGDTKDIELKKLQDFLDRLEKESRIRNDYKKTNP